MAGSNGRAKRHFFGGTGLYIALFLGVTALAVAGYWTLLPKNTTDKDAENVSSQVELPVQDETPQMPGAELPQPARRVRVRAVPRARYFLKFIGLLPFCFQRVGWNGALSPDGMPYSWPGRRRAPWRSG